MFLTAGLTLLSNVTVKCDNIPEVFGSRRRPPDMKGSRKYTEQAVADSRQGVILQLWGWGEGLTTPRHKK
jgi:hypothetical protein